MRNASVVTSCRLSRPSSRIDRPSIAAPASTVQVELSPTFSSRNSRLPDGQPPPLFNSIHIPPPTRYAHDTTPRYHHWSGMARHTSPSRYPLYIFPITSSTLQAHGHPGSTQISRTLHLNTPLFPKFTLLPVYFCIRYVQSCYQGGTIEDCGYSCKGPCLDRALIILSCRPGKE